MFEYRDAIREIREDRGFTQLEIARRLGITQQTYSRYETGANEIPIRHVIALSRLYAVSADYLLGLPPGLPYPGEKNSK